MTGVLTYRITEDGAPAITPDVLQAARSPGKYSHVYSRQRYESVVMERVIGSMFIASCGTDADHRTHMARMHWKLLFTEH